MKLTPLEIAILLEQLKLLMKWVQVSNKLEEKQIDLKPLKKLQRKLIYEKRR